MHQVSPPLNPKAPRRLRQAVAGLLCALTAALHGPALGAPSSITVAMDQVLWLYTGDRFHCELKLSVENFGTLSFVHEAGHELKFRVNTLLSPGATPAVSLQSSHWRQAPAHAPMALVKQPEGLVLNAEHTRQLLAALNQRLWFGIELNRLTLNVPTIHWETGAEQFEQCQKQLSPFSIAQARDRALFYRQGQRALSTEQLQELAQLARYIALDPQVTRVLVDSYTDNTGSRLGNLQLSRERAADVAAALREFGVPAKLIEQRAHGERYPSANNETPEGRDLNRRVTLRIIRKNGN